MLIHGFAEDGRIWEHQRDRLSTVCRLLIPDLPGSGRSSSPQHDQLPKTIDEHADALKAILDEEKLKSCILIGHSMGGYIALALAEKYPAHSQALGLFHSTAYADPEEKKANRKKSIGFIRKHGAAAFIRQSLPELFAEDTRVKNPGIISALIDRYDNFNAESLVSYQEAMITRPDRTAVLSEFEGPVLFVCGENDRTIPLAQSLMQCHIPGLSYIHILENAGHMGMLEEPEKSTGFLLDFIKKVHYDS